ncbi:MAG: cyclic lactone autoinducer peptide [Bacillota bacterium]|nr:cyclic lactone autoinducer peptide [Bacillota bacterium]MDW7683778.1 cyclic lactone autoinducer peptide [Bacillota bacterium]
MKKRLLTLVVALLSLVAFSGAASACNAFLYQQELPEALRK